MRKQYHSRLTSRGRLIWSVHHLIELSAELPRIWVALSTISELDEPFWFGGAGDVATCRAVADHAKLIQDTDLAYPIILSSDGRVMDGMHRVAKAHMLGHSDIKAVRFEVDPEPDYVDVPEDQLPYDDQ
jgi:hypothetical protein